MWNHIWFLKTLHLLGFSCLSFGNLYLILFDIIRSGVHDISPFNMELVTHVKNHWLPP